MMQAELPIIGGYVLMATDMLRSMDQQTRIGNNTTLCLDLASREEADRTRAPPPSSAVRSATRAGSRPWARTCQPELASCLAR